MKPDVTRYLPAAAGAATVALGIEPLVWLVQAQASPAQARLAVVRLLLLAAVVAWSTASPRLRCKRRSLDFGLVMLGTGLVCRLVGLAFGIRHVGALALICDLYAVGWLLDWPGRRRRLSPLFVAAAAVFCLPVDRPLYRILGYPAQWLWREASGYRTSPELLVDVGILACFVGLLALAFRHRPVAGVPSWRRVRKPLTVLLVTGGVAFLFLLRFPPPPVDRGLDLTPPRLPARWGTHELVPLSLSVPERAFFAAVGGNAAKGRYGDATLLVIESTAPLRHLHSPTWCLAGLGHDVELIGYSTLPYPAAHYRGKTPEGKAYDVESTFASSDGDLVAEVSEAIWRWLPGRTGTWRSIQVFRPMLPRPRRFQPVPRELFGTSPNGAATGPASRDKFREWTIP